MSKGDGNAKKAGRKNGRILAWALRNGVRKGFMGSDRKWLVVGGIALGVKVLRKIAGSEPQVVYRAEVEPGQTLVIAHGRLPE